MIDSLRFRLKNYKIERENFLTIQPPTITNGIQNQPYTLYKDHSYIMEGTKAYFNDDFYQISLILQHGEPCLFIQFSVPKVLSGTNYHLIDSPKTFIKALQATEKRLRDIGIHTNINDAYLSRLDLTRNVYPKYSYLTYRPIFEHLSMSRSYNRDYGTSFMYLNKQKQFVVYDKLKEMAFRKELNKGLPITIRNELRFMNLRKIKDVTGMTTAGELQSGFDSLSNIYNSTIQKDIIKSYNPLNDSNVISNDFLETIVTNSLTKDGFSFSKMFKLGFITCILDQGTKQRLIEIVTALAPNRMVASRIRTVINKLEMELIRYNLIPNTSPVPISELFKEYTQLLLKTD